MIQFISPEFQKEFLKVLQFIMEEFGSIDKLIDTDEFVCDINQLYSDITSLVACTNYDPEDEYDDVIISNQTCITLHLADTDDEDIYEEITLQQLMNIIEQYKSIRTMTLGKCISPDVAFYVINSEQDDFVLQQAFLNYNGFYNDIVTLNSIYNGKGVRCSIVLGITLFGMMILKQQEYNEYFPPVSCRDLFIKIESEDLSDDDYDIIVNAYIFELSACDVLDVSLSSRPEYPYDDEVEDFLIQTEYLDPLIFSKGLDIPILIFNNGLKTIDINHKIIEFTRVIEHISQTVIRLEKTERIQSKLSRLRAINADADYIRELEQVYDDLKNKYAKDSDLIKATIQRCCDMDEIGVLSPEYLRKVASLSSSLAKPKSDRLQVIEAAKEELAQAISDTRNEISHAKANYIGRGKECPNEEKGEFVKMLKVVAIQVIRWYSNIHESQRITANSPG